MTTDEQRKQWIDKAYSVGVDRANMAASWTYDGNSDVEERARVLAMLRAGDPVAHDYLPRRPDLSGEFAEELTPQRLACDIVGDALDGISDEAELIDELSNAHDEGVDDTFEQACEIELIEFCEPETDYTVVWTIELSARTPKAAAEKALAIQRDPKTMATVFEVDGEQIDLSLSDADEPYL